MDNLWGDDQQRKAMILVGEFCKEGDNKIFLEFYPAVCVLIWIVQCRYLMFLNYIKDWCLVQCSFITSFREKDPWHSDQCVQGT